MTDRGEQAKPAKSSRPEAVTSRTEQGPPRPEHGKPSAATDPHRDLAGVLHDVSNVLTVLLGWVSEARAPSAAPETQAYALTIVEQRARMARDLARHAIGAPRFDEQRAIGPVARDVVDALRLAASEVGTAVVMSGEDTTATVAGALDVSQVLTNLVMNALAHAPRGSEITVDVAAEDECVSIVVSDQGPGVPADHSERIFLGQSLRPGGTGVGLRHSREVARASGGDVELLPAVRSGGARFRLSWPRVDAVPRPPVSTPRARELAGLRVLVLEDDPAVTQLLETALEARGADVIVATTSAELSAAIAGATYQAALLDLSPIAEDAGQAIARLQKSSPGIDLVLITGSADRLPDDVPAEALKLVRKPFELAEVLAALTNKAS
ncbi:MAG TPA: ATP-binding protein [Labilithrix sp.]|nr:ATP-binding protein [Labilithrix sp.]